MPDLSSRLSLPLLLPAQAQKHVTHNEALVRLDALVQAVAETRNTATPPAVPTLGASHIVPAGATDDWAGQTDALAVHDGTAWVFHAPRPGWRVYVTAEGQGVVWDGSAWVVDRPGLDDLDGVGIGTASDSVNRLAVASDAVLFSHAGAGHQIKVNKAATGDTASLLFQTGWSGRAEMGTAGGDDFAIKLSADGSAWTTALQFDAASGAVSGASVQSAPDDTTAGRLMRADYGYGPGNLVGAVAQAAGVPTGAAQEEGENANGSFLRLACGVQICWREITADIGGSTVWNFPASFANAPDGLSGSIRGAAARFVAFGTPSHTAVAVRVYNTAGALSTTDCFITAIGRWF